MQIPPLELYESGLFSTSITFPFGMIINIKDSLILKDMTQIVYSSQFPQVSGPKNNDEK